MVTRRASQGLHGVPHVGCRRCSVSFLCYMPPQEHLLRTPRRQHQRPQKHQPPTSDNDSRNTPYSSARVNSRPPAPPPPLPAADDDEDEDFGWGEDDQDEDNNNNNNSPDLFPSRPPPASPSAQDPSPPPSPRAGDPRPPAGGALGAMRPEQERAAAADDEAVSPPVGGSAVGGVKSLASSAAMAEIARLNAALRESEAGRASLAAAAEEGRVSSPGSIGHGVKGEGDGEIGELRRERDAAVAEVRRCGLAPLPVGGVHLWVCLGCVLVILLCSFFVYVPLLQLPPVFSLRFFGCCYLPTSAVQRPKQINHVPNPAAKS